MAPSTHKQTHTQTNAHTHTHTHISSAEALFLRWCIVRLFRPLSGPLSNSPFACRAPTAAEVVRLYSGSIETPPAAHVPLMRSAAQTQIARLLSVEQVRPVARLRVCVCVRVCACACVCACEASKLLYCRVILGEPAPLAVHQTHLHSTTLQEPSTNYPDPPLPLPSPFPVGRLGASAHPARRRRLLRDHRKPPAYFKPRPPFFPPPLHAAVYIASYLLLFLSGRQRCTELAAGLCASG